MIVDRHARRDRGIPFSRELSRIYARKKKKKKENRKESEVRLNLHLRTEEETKRYRTRCMRTYIATYFEIRTFKEKVARAVTWLFVALSRRLSPTPGRYWAARRRFRSKELRAFRTRPIGEGFGAFVRNAERKKKMQTCSFRARRCRNRAC